MCHICPNYSWPIPWLTKAIVQFAQLFTQHAPKVVNKVRWNKLCAPELVDAKRHTCKKLGWLICTQIVNYISTCAKTNKIWNNIANMQGNNAVETSKTLCGSICQSSFAWTRSLVYLHLVEGSISFSHFLVHTLTPMYISKNIKTYLSSFFEVTSGYYLLFTFKGGLILCSASVCTNIACIHCFFSRSKLYISDLIRFVVSNFRFVVASFGTKRKRRRQLQKILFIQSCKP
jgi:hypothetical protein